MLSKEQIIKEVKGGRKSGSLDGRDYSRLIDFFDGEQFPIFGFELKTGAEHVGKEFTEENVLEQVKKDIAFGFEKALDQRGLSAGAMYAVAQMWMWVLEDDLQHHDSYAMYGLPLFKAVAEKYGFENPIGGDSGAEQKYNG